MVLEKNGQVVSSGPPAAFGLYGSLDNMIFDSILTVTMCNTYGCGEDSANVQRNTQRPRAEGAVSAQYADYIFTDIFESPPIGVRIGYESYTRILESEIFYASYSVPTSGARNGRQNMCIAPMLCCGRTESVLPPGSAIMKSFHRGVGLRYRKPA